MKPHTAQQPNSPTAQQPNSPTAQQPNSPTAVRRKGSKGIFFAFYIFLIAIFFFPPFGGTKGGCQNIAVNESGNPANGSAIFDIQPDVNLDKGLLIPRLSTIERNNIVSPAPFLMICNITCSCFQIYVNGSWQDVWCPTGNCCAAPGQPGTITGSTPVSCSTTQNYSIATVNNATSYNWTLSGGGNIQSGQGSTSINVYWNTAGTFTVSVTASNSCGTSAAQTLVVTVNGPCCTLTASAGTNTVVACTGTNYTIGGSPTASGGTSPYTYSWVPATNLNYLFVANPVANPVTNTTYTVTVTDAAGCTATSTVSITINCTNTWCPKANFVGTARYSAASFSIGTKGYIGTGWDGAYKQDFWEWDQASNAWTQKANFPGTARYGAYSFSIGSMGYIGLGILNDAPGNFSVSDFYQYNPSTNIWTPKANCPIARHDGEGISIDTDGDGITDRGYICGGSTCSSCGVYATNNFYEYNPITNSWAVKANYPIAILRETGFSIGTKGYMGCGMFNAGGPTTLYNTFYEYDPITNTWTQKADFGGTARYLASGFSIGTKGYIGTGYDGAYKNDFYEYTWGAGVMGGSWVAKAVFGGTARYAAAGFSIGTKGYIGTGYDGAYKQDFWEYCQ